MHYPIIDGKVQTRALEYHIADHCNLRCDHCCSFSPILKKWFADPAVFERDLTAIRRVVAPQFLKIVGGEPLLHPELERLLRIAKLTAVASGIQLTTNGILLERLSNSGWECLDMLSISLYPEPALSKALIRSIAREAAARKIQVNWKVQDKFTCLDRDEPADDRIATQIFQDCWIRHRCNSVKQGRFYSCTRPQYVQKFASDPKIFLEDGIPVEDDDAEALARRIKQHLERTEPLRSCFLCQGGNAPLDTNRQLTPNGIRVKRERLVMLSAQIAPAIA